MRAAMIAQDARHADDYGGDENYKTKDDDHGSPGLSRWDSGCRWRELSRPVRRDARDLVPRCSWRTLFFRVNLGFAVGQRRGPGRRAQHSAPKLTLPHR